MAEGTRKDRGSMIRSGDLNHTFIDEVIAEPGGEHLLTCWSCGTCASTCIVRRYDPAFNPRVILHKAGLGLRDDVLSSAEIWHCSACDICYPKCPKGIHISDVMRAIRDLAIKSGHARPDVTAQVNVERCVACGMCVATCPYEAITLQDVKWNRRTKRAAQVDANLCMSCGICNAACPSSSISVATHTDAVLHRSFLSGLPSQLPALKDAWRGKVLAIVCNWCLRWESDLEYVANPPEHVMVMNVPCSGRVAPTFVMTALQHGVERVVVVGCEEEQCHYKQGNLLEKRRMAALRSLLDLLGLEQTSVEFVRVGPLERGKLRRVLDNVAKELESVQELATARAS